MARNLITRTFSNTVAHALVYIDNAARNQDVILPAGFTTASAEKAIRKNHLVTGHLITVTAVEKLDATYGMEISVFLANAVQFTERSKDTRNMITKYATVRKGTLVTYSPADGMHEHTVAVPANVKSLDAWARENAPDGEIGVTVKDITESTALFAMTEADFIKLARPMTDNQHFSD